jgi:hypothetical protein
MQQVVRHTVTCVSTSWSTAAFNAAERSPARPGSRGQIRQKFGIVAANTNVLRRRKMNLRWPIRATYLTVFVLIATPFCEAQDASCKAVVDAEVLAMRTPHHVISTDVHGSRSTVTEEIYVPSGVFWASNGTWHKARGSMQESARDTMDSNRELRDCHRIVDEVVDGQPATKYAFHNHASGGDDTVWISKGSGLVLKTESLIEDRHISSRYSYSNIQAPANVR